MNNSDWNELEKTWQSLPEIAAPALKELRREQRWRLLSQFYFFGEIVVSLIGIGAAGWLMARGGAVFVALGVATFLFVVGATGLSFWARAVVREGAEGPVSGAIVAARRRAQIGVRQAYAILWSVVAGMTFIAVIVFVADEQTFAPSSTAIGLGLIWLGLWLAGVIVYFPRRLADLERLKALEASVRGEI